jgi:hypothetical protein
MICDLLRISAMSVFIHRAKALDGQLTMYSARQKFMLEKTAGVGTATGGLDGVE